MRQVNHVKLENMPFYEYECGNCRFYVEVLQKISDQPLKKCPSCGKNALKKLVSAPVFRLKGSGWYETDFKSDQENKRNLAGTEKDESSSDNKAETKDAASADSKSESKSDAKGDAKDAKDAKGDAKGAKGGGKAETKTAKASPAKRGAGAVRAKASAGAKSAKRPVAKSKPAAKRRRGR